MKEQRPDQDAERLRSVLSSVTPEDRGNSSRAAQVERRELISRRRRRTVSATAVAAVALVLIIAPHVIDGSPVTRADTPKAAAGLASPVTCQSPAAGHQVRASAYGVIPDGAVLARICPQFPVRSPWAAPVDALTTNLGRVIENVNAQPTTANPNLGGCPMDLDQQSQAYTITFEYADGGITSLRGDGVGCLDILVDGHARSGGDQVLQAYGDALAAQRTNSTPPTTVGALHCPNSTEPAGSLLPVDPSHLQLRRAVFCQTQPAKLLRRLSPTQVRMVNADFAAHATTQAPRPLGCLNPVPSVLFGVSAWGDPVPLVDDCGTFQLYFDHVSWTPPQDVLDSILSR